MDSCIRYWILSLFTGHPFCCSLSNNGLSDLHLWAELECAITGSCFGSPTITTAFGLNLNGMTHEASDPWQASYKWDSPSLEWSLLYIQCEFCLCKETSVHIFWLCGLCYRPRVSHIWQIFQDHACQSRSGQVAFGQILVKKLLMEDAYNL